MPLFTTSLIRPAQLSWQATHGLVAHGRTENRGDTGSMATSGGAGRNSGKLAMHLGWGGVLEGLPRMGNSI
jgi:hypothetical protein